MTSTDVAQLSPSPAIAIDPSEGAVLDGRLGSLRVPWHEALAARPLTLQSRLLLRRAGDWLVVCRSPREVETWVLAVGKSGDLVLRFPGRGTSFGSGRPLLDERWHDVEVTVDAEAPRLSVDGEALPLEAHKPGAPDAAPYPHGLQVGTHLETAHRAVCFASVSHIRLIHDSVLVGAWRFDDMNDGPVANEVLHGATGLLEAPENLPATPLDEADRVAFQPGPSPLEGPALELPLAAGRGADVAVVPNLLLDGEWELVEGREGDDVAIVDWSDAIPAAVPGSVHAALEAAGRIPDPKFGRNDAIAREQSYKPWWYRRRFSRPQGSDHRLVFDGVAIHCTVWLNGTQLGTHDGMFGGPSFGVAQLLRDENELVVRIEPVVQGGRFIADDNGSWRNTVVFNNVYGWHYSYIPSLGIWRSVRVEPTPEVRMQHPFIATRDVAAGIVTLVVDLDGPATGWGGTLLGTIAPDNFGGEPVHFEHRITANEAARRERFQFQIPNPRAWWPNGHGEQNLYRLALRFVADTGGRDAFDTTFGLRTIEMTPLPAPDGPSLLHYNWTFVVNGKPIFMKGTGWCTMDSSMDFRRSRYERFLRVAQEEHCQIVRAWGSGMPETDDFYDLCDRLGLLVMQEWPTAWNSHRTQPYAALEETVRLNTLRLRNHPSLAMWGGGNESGEPFGEAIDMMGRYSVELDGTRPFHRGEPWGGSQHNYDCWWERKHLDHNLTMTAPFWGEFGLPSFPPMESVRRYVPAEELGQWPTPTAAEGGSFAHHIPVFNLWDEMARFRQYVASFSEGATMARFVVATQAAQSVGARHTLERSRVRWPACTGALLYKLNDNYPGASWSTADWYGALKMAHWFVQDAFAPVAACVLFDRLDLRGGGASLPVHLLDDVDALAGQAWRAVVRVYDGTLTRIHEQAFNVRKGEHGLLGTVDLSAEQTANVPLLVMSEVIVDPRVLHRTFYFVNFEAVKDSLFDLPTTTLSLAAGGGVATVTNTGSLPAVGVTLLRPGHADTFSADDGCFWLEPRESRRIRVSHDAGLAVDAWNLVGKEW